jgi:hypothetical protein
MISNCSGKSKQPILPTVYFILLGGGLPHCSILPRKAGYRSPTVSSSIYLWILPCRRQLLFRRLRQVPETISAKNAKTLNTFLMGLLGSTSGSTSALTNQN